MSHPVFEEIMVRGVFAEGDRIVPVPKEVTGLRFCHNNSEVQAVAVHDTGRITEHGLRLFIPEASGQESYERLLAAVDVFCLGCGVKATWEGSRVGCENCGDDLPRVNVSISALLYLVNTASRKR